MKRLPISPAYDRPIFEAVTFQIAICILAALTLDGGGFAQMCGIALPAFWGGAAVLIWRHPQSPSRLDIELIRFGYFVVILITYFLAQWIWHLRGVL